MSLLLLFAYNTEASDDVSQPFHVFPGGNMTGETVRGIF